MNVNRPSLSGSSYEYEHEADYTIVVYKLSNYELKPPNCTVVVQKHKSVFLYLMFTTFPTMHEHEQASLE